MHGEQQPTASDNLPEPSKDDVADEAEHVQPLALTAGERAKRRDLCQAQKRFKRSNDAIDAANAAEQATTAVVPTLPELQQSVGQQVQFFAL